VIANPIPYDAVLPNDPQSTIVETDTNRVDILTLQLLELETRVRGICAKKAISTLGISLDIVR
jgi:hypothetical protein